MPMIRFTCECGNSFRKLFRAGSPVPALYICTCGKEAQRVLKGPSGLDTKIAVDNGVQARSIDISVDQIKDNENRARFKEKMREKP